MKKIAYLGIVLLSMGLFVLSCGKDDGPGTPDTMGLEIESVDPESGPVGTKVTLDGNNFGDTMADNTVKFSGVTAQIVTASTTRLTVEVPDGATDGPITVKVGENTATSSTDFVVTPSAVELNNTTLGLNTFDTHTLQVENLEDFVDMDIQWEVNNGDVLEVDDNGNLFALQAGTAMVTATIGSISGTCSVTIEPSFFVAGYEYEGNESISKVWLNGVEHFSLTDGTKRAEANSIYVFRKDIYVAGLLESSDDNTYAVIWKNHDESFNLTEGNSEAAATSVIADAQGFNGVGYEDNLGNYVGYRWTELGDEIVFDEGEGPTRLHSISIGNDGTYIAGASIMIGMDKDHAHIWKDDISHLTLTDGNNFAYARDVAVADEGVYAVGAERNVGYYVAKAWKDGDEIYTLANAENASYATSVEINENGDVFICGHESVVGNKLGRIWKNGELLTTIDTGSETELYSIAIYGDYVLVTGTRVENGNTLATVWKINKEGEVIETTTLNKGLGWSYAYSIFVK